LEFWVVEIFLGEGMARKVKSKRRLAKISCIIEHLRNFGCDFRVEISLGNFVRGVCNRSKKENPNFALLA
jgi:hypothetical protein